MGRVRWKADCRNWHSVVREWSASLWALNVGDFFSVVKAGDFFSVVKAGDSFSVVKAGDSFSVVKAGDASHTARSNKLCAPKGLVLSTISLRIIPPSLAHWRTQRSSTDTSCGLW